MTGSSGVALIILGAGVIVACASPSTGAFEGSGGNGDEVDAKSGGSNQAQSGAGSPGPGGTKSASAGGAPQAGNGGIGESNGGGGEPFGGTPSSGTGGDVGCESLPPVADYAAPGPFTDVKMFTAVGPNGNYTLFRPDASLGKNNFKHPIASWGNGITTTPDQYEQTLTLIASHGFVIIACNDTQVERPCMSDGLDWLIQQNDTGPMMGKLDLTREVTIGYSWGGGGAIDTANRDNVKATVSLHGMPPRETDAFAKMHAPLLLFTSTGDTFVTADEYVTPNYQSSVVQTFYATFDDATAGHLYVVDEGAAVCVGGLIGLGACQNAAVERAPTIAWLRLWACGDQQAKSFFYGDDCTLCQSPWTNPQRKEWK